MTEATNPGDRSFDDPSLWYDLEAGCGVGSLDDFDFPGAARFALSKLANQTDLLQYEYSSH
jgi:hypothetical protein